MAMCQNQGHINKEARPEFLGAKLVWHLYTHGGRLGGRRGVTAWLAHIYTRRTSGRTSFPRNDCKILRI